MDPAERPGKEDELLFEELLQLETEAERSTFLDERCAGNPDLRKWLESLLEGYLQSDFMDELPSSLSQMMEVPQRLIGQNLGRYQISEGIGSGGMGDVYLACDNQDPKIRVAIKVIKPGMDSRQIMRRFELERQILERLDHPNIAEFIESGTTQDGYVYFAMEYVPGIPLDAFCNRMRLSIRDRVGLAIRICEAVSHAHEKGVIHRDLKPSNILVFQRRGEAIPKVIDFGIAKALSTDEHQSVHLTFATQWVGTSRYASPEQRDWASDVDQRSDVYSLGIVLLELLFGCSQDRLGGRSETKSKTTSRNGGAKSVASDDLDASVRCHQIDDEIAAARRSSARELASWWKGPLGWIAMKSSSQDRELRYESVALLRADLEAWLQGKRVAARRPRRQTVANRRFIAIAAVAICLLLPWAWPLIKSLGDVGGNHGLSMDAKRAFAFEIKEAFTAVEQGNDSFISDGLKNWEQIAQRGHLGFVVHLLDEYRKGSQSNPLIQAPKWRSCSTHPSGRVIATGSENGEVTFFDAESGRRLRVVKIAEVEISALSFSPNGTWLAIGAKDGLVRIWSMETFLIRHVFSKHENTVSAISWSPSSDWLCTGDRFGAIELWDVLNLKHVGTMRSRTDHDFAVRELAWSPSGRWIAAATKKEGTIVWPAHQMEAAYRLGDKDSTGVSFSPDELLLAATNYDSKLTIVSTLSGGVEYSTTMPTTMSTVQFCAGNALLATSHNGTLYALIRSIDSKTWFTHSRVKLSGKGERLETCDWNIERGVFVFYTQSEETDCFVHVLSQCSLFGYRNPRSELRAIGVLSKKQQVLSHSPNSGKVIWSRIEDGRILKELPIPTSLGAPFAEDWDGRFIAFAGDLGPLKHRAVYVLDCATMEVLKKLELPESEVCNLAFSQDGRSLAIGSHSAELRLWDLESGAVRLVDLGDVKDRAVQPLFSPDGSRLVVVPFNHAKLQVWDSKGEGRLGEIKFTHHFNKGVFHPDGRLFLAQEARVSVVDVFDMIEVDSLSWSPNSVFHSIHDNIEHLALSPDCSVLALTVGPRIHLWDWATKTRLKVLGVPATKEDCARDLRQLHFHDDHLLLHYGRHEGFVTMIGDGATSLAPEVPSPYHRDVDLVGLASEE